MLIRGVIFIHLHLFFMLTQKKLTRFQVYGLALLSLLLAYGLMLSSANRKSPTVDEQSHLFRGVAYLQEGATHFLLGHPLGASIWAAIPVLTEPDLSLPVDSPAWEDGNWSVAGSQFLWQLNDNPQRIIFLGRLAMIWLTLLLGGLIFRWGRALAGPTAGIAAMVLVLLDPNVLAHGRLVTDDLPVAFGFLLTVYGFWGWAQASQHNPSANQWHWLLLAGLGLGLASVFKYSAALLLPILATLAVWLAWQRRSWQPIIAAGITAVIGGLFIWTVYGMALRPLPGGAFWDDLFWVMGYFGQPHGAYLLGQTSGTGWWYYFPVAYLLKTPLPILMLLLLALVLLVKQAFLARTIPVAPFLIIPTFFYLIASLSISLNIGYRHLLPMLPFIALLLVVYLWRDGAHYGRVVVVGAAILVTAVSLWQWPDYIPYYNLLAGDSEQRWQLLSDSNIDWGQDLPALAAWQQETGHPLNLSYFGTAYPSAYGLQFEPLPTWAPGPEQIRADWQLYNPSRPTAGYYAISVTNLHGVVLGSNRDAFAYFREKIPLARIGQSIFVYEVEPEGEPIDIALSQIVPAAIVDPLWQRWPGNQWQVRLFAAHTSLIWSPGGMWVVVPAESEPVEPLRSFWPEQPEQTAVSQQLYHIQPDLPAWADQAIPFGEVLTLRGVQRLATAPDRVELVTIWQVEAETKRPLQLFIHALTDDNQIAGQWDGLDVVPRFWSTGDLFVQFHTFSVAEVGHTPPLAIGVYDAETGERLGEPLFIRE